MRDSDATKRRILWAAAALLAEQGLDGLTFAKLREASGAATGSITHFFDDKAGLAAAVADDLASGLAADAERVLQAAHGQDAAAAVGALIAAALHWPSKFPGRQRLIGMMAAFTPRSSQVGIEQRLAQVLENWAQPWIRNGAIAPLSPSQLYAVLLAPALCAAADAEAKRQEPSIDWRQILTAAALAAIRPEAKSKRSRRAGAKAPHGMEQLGL